MSAAASTNAATNGQAQPQNGGLDVQPFFPDEVPGPIIKTKIPGPNSLAITQRLNKVFDVRSLNMVADYQSSYGN